MTHEEMYRIFREKNDAGKGFAIGNETDTPAEAAHRDGYTVIDQTCDGVCHCDSPEIIVADANGPWAVYVRD